MIDSPRPAVSTVSRRAVVRTAAWSVPAISVVAAAPAFAASGVARGTLRFLYEGDPLTAASYEGWDSEDPDRSGARFGLQLDGLTIAVDRPGPAPAQVTVTVTFESSPDSGHPSTQVGLVDHVPAGWELDNAAESRAVAPEAAPQVLDPDSVPEPLTGPPALLGMYSSLVFRSRRQVAEGANGELTLSGWLASTNYEDPGTFLLTFRADGFNDLLISFETPRPDSED